MNYFSQKQTQPIPCEGNTSITLLVPEHLLGRLHSILDLVERKKLIRFLLKKYRFLFQGGHIPFSNQCKIRYQDVGLGLSEWKLRVPLRDWLELGMWAYSLGFSRCLLFSILLELDDSLIGEMSSEKELRRLVATPNRCQPMVQWALRNGRTQFERTQTIRRPGQ